MTLIWRFHPSSPHRSFAAIDRASCPAPPRTRPAGTVHIPGMRREYAQRAPHPGEAHGPRLFSVIGAATMREGAGVTVVTLLMVHQLARFRTPPPRVSSSESYAPHSRSLRMSCRPGSPSANDGVDAGGDGVWRMMQGHRAWRVPGGNPPRAHNESRLEPAGNIGFTSG